jgi:hypothetical protein
LNVSVFDGWLPVDDAVDDAALSASMTVTGPCAVGVRLNVYVVPLPETAPTVAFVAVMLDVANVPTDSENVAVIGMVVAFVVVALVDDKTTVGPPASANERDAKPPRTATAVMTLTAAAERIPICLDFILANVLLMLISFGPTFS